jgi:multisubunit Na+/H+ antiporter MnhE subunit
MNGRMKFGFIIAFVVLLMFFAFLSLVFLSPFALGGISGMNSAFVAVRTVIVLAAFFIIEMILAMIMSAVTWGQWLGDFKKQKERS